MEKSMGLRERVFFTAHCFINKEAPVSLKSNERDLWGGKSLIEPERRFLRQWLKWDPEHGKRETGLGQVEGGFLC